MWPGEEIKGTGWISLTGIPCEGSYASGSAGRLKLLPKYSTALSASSALDRDYI